MSQANDPAARETGMRAERSGAGHAGGPGHRVRAVVRAVSVGLTLAAGFGGLLLMLVVDVRDVVAQAADPAVAVLSSTR